MNPIKHTICAAAAISLAGCATNAGFSKADTNRDKSVSYPEFDAYMKDEIFRQVDADNDGKVSQAEWRAVNAKDPVSEFRRADHNSDGFISRTEADADFDKQGSLRKLFNKIDTDGSGTLSDAEIQTFHGKYRAAQGSTDLQKLSNAADS